MVPLFERRIGDVGGKRKLDDWSIERNSSRASDDVALEMDDSIQLCSFQTYRETHRQIGGDRVLWGSEVMKADVPGRGAGRYRIPLCGVGRLRHIVLRVKGLIAQFEAIDAIGDETDGGHACLRTVESALEGRVRSGGAGGGESHWARGRENEVVGITGHGRQMLYRLCGVCGEHVHSSESESVAGPGTADACAWLPVCACLARVPPGWRYRPPSLGVFVVFWTSRRTALRPAPPLLQSFRACSPCARPTLAMGREGGRAGERRAQRARGSQVICGAQINLISP